MSKLKITLLAIMLTISVLASTVAVQPVTVAQPNEPNLYIKQYSNPGQAWAGLITGEIDVMGCPLTPMMYQEWLNDPNLRQIIGILLTYDLGMFEFDLNSNDTITGWGEAFIAYPGKVNPMHDPAFRRAIAKAVDKESIARIDFLDTLEIMDVPLIPPVHAPYINSSVVGANYAYKYNLVQAAADLDAAGYIIGPDGWRINAATGNSLYDDLSDGVHHGLIFYTPADKPDRLAAGTRYAEVLHYLHIPVLRLAEDESFCSSQVNGQMAYHIYAGAQTLTRDPDHLHDWYTEEFIYPWGQNYLMFRGGPHIEADLDAVKYAPNHNALIAACKHVQSHLWGGGGEMAHIILGHTKPPMMTAFRKDMITGVVNEECTGAKSWWTTSIGKKIANPIDTIRFGLGSTVEQLSPVNSSWSSDWTVLERIYDSLIGNDAYTLSIDMPTGLAKWWKVENYAEVIGEYLGTGNGVNSVFTLSSSKADEFSESVYLNGVRQTRNVDYTINYATGVITFYTAPLLGVFVTADYKYQPGSRTKLVFKLRDGLKWHDDPARDYPNGAPLTPEDVKFSIEYHKAQNGWWHNNVKDVSQVIIRSNGEIAVYMNISGFLALHWIGEIPIIPKYIWENIYDAYRYDPITGIGGGGDGIPGLIGSGPWTPKRLPNGQIDPTFYVAEDHVSLQANTDYYMTASDVVSFLKECARRRGDADYSGYTEGLDLAKIALKFSALSYQPIPTWTDDVYPEMIYCSPFGTPGAPPPCPAFDDSGIIYIGTNWNGRGFPWWYEDLNCDNKVFVEELAILAASWHHGFVGTSWP